MICNHNWVKYFYLTLFCFLFFVGYAQKKNLISTGNVTFSKRQEPNETPYQAKRKAVELAKIQAFKDVFGTAMGQNNASYTQNTQNGNDVKTNQSFTSLTDSYVNGEWIKDKDGFPKIEKVFQNNETWYKVTVNGWIRKIVGNKYDFESYSLNCYESLQCQTKEFKNDESLYQFFKSSINGYLAIYLEDPNLEETFMLFPYSKSELTTFNVKADSSYLLFYNPKSNSFNLKTPILNTIDQLELSLDDNRMVENYLVHVLFSSKEFRKPIVDNKTEELKEEVELKQGYTLPRSSKSSDFTKWLQRMRVSDENIQLLSYGISLTK
tara:strand:+ start:142 stop:1110 length:969 start_codon:yes stop_codon:yes gene_type:complete